MSSKERTETLRRLREVKVQLEELEALKTELSVEVAGYEPDDLTYTADDGVVWTAQVSVRTTPKINLAKLMTLDPKLAHKITKEVVDTVRLNETLDQGLWSEELRDSVVTFHLSNPGVRFVRARTATTEKESA